MTTPSKSIRVLLVDDHTVLRDGLRLLLQCFPDMEVVGEAATGRAALEQVERKQPDVVVMDINMPDMDGVEATRRLQELHPEVKVLVLTNYDEEQFVANLVQNGATGYLLKSAAGDELVSAIRTVHGGGSALQPGIARKLVDSYVRMGTQRNRKTLEPHETLTRREMEILKLAARGMSNKRIADSLFLSVRTVENYMTTIYNKLGVTERTEAVLYALRKALVSLPGDSDAA